MTMTTFVQSAANRYPRSFILPLVRHITTNKKSIGGKFSSKSSPTKIENEIRKTLKIAVPTLLEQTKNGLMPSSWGKTDSSSSSSSKNVKKIDNLLEQKRDALIPSSWRKAASSSSSPLMNDKTIDSLAILNGYHKVQLEPHSVPLASGVLAEASKSIGKHYAVFARRSNNDDNTSSNYRNALKRTQHPPFLIEDYTIYRIMENYIEQYLNQKEEQIKNWFQSNVEHTKAEFNKTADRMYKPVSKLVESVSNKTQSKPSEDPKMTAKGDALDNSNAQNVNGNSVDPSLATAVSAALKDNDSDDKKIKETQNEDLMIVTRDGQVLLFEDVPTQFRILVLPKIQNIGPPYRMKHGRAGTVLYSGVVFFGAVPVAYRSLNFALDYPGLAQMIIASVVGSMSYSFWASRESARTLQSLTVTRGAASRLVACDTAALSLLKDGAIEALLEEVIKEYLGRLKGHKAEETKEKIESENEKEVILVSNIHPLDVAVELGLLERGKSGGELVAVDWEDARSRILERATKTLLGQ